MCKELIEPIINFFVHFPEPDEPLPEPPPIDEQVAKTSRFPPRFPLPGQIKELPDYKTFIRQDNVVSKKENKDEWELV